MEIDSGENADGNGADLSAIVDAFRNPKNDYGVTGQRPPWKLFPRGSASPKESGGNKAKGKGKGKDKYLAGTSKRVGKGRCSKAGKGGTAGARNGARKRY